MRIGDIKDIAVLALVGVGAYLIWDTFKGGKSARSIGETIGGAAVRVPGQILAGGLAGAQSAVTGQSPAEIYAHAREGAAILNEMTENSLLNWIPIIGPSLTGWKYSGAYAVGGELNPVE